MNLSIIIPVLNEEANLAKTLESLFIQKKYKPQVIVVDGGSQDKTLAIARNFPVTLVHSPKGRGIQCNQGAVRAKGDLLLFLHADTQLPLNSLALLDKAFSNAHVKCSLFKLRFDTHRGLFRFYSLFTLFDNILTSFGDQGICVRKDFFNDLGGFPNSVIFEDVQFLEKVRQKTRIKKINSFVTTSARMFNTHGFFIQQLKNGFLMLRYFTGTSPKQLYRMYYNKKMILRPPRN